jgi:hypothetical protein
MLASVGGSLAQVSFGFNALLIFVKKSREFLLRAGVLIWNVGKGGEATLKACAGGANGGRRFLEGLERKVCGGSH